MTYTVFDYAAPVTTQTRQQTVDSARENLLALRDAIVMGGMESWNMDVGDSSSTATPTYTSVMADSSQPGIIRYRKSPEEILLWITWNIDGYPTVIKYYYSPDYTGGGYPANRDIIKQEDITYDGSLNVSSIVWS